MQRAWMIDLQSRDDLAIGQAVRRAVGGVAPQHALARIPWLGGEHLDMNLPAQGSKLLSVEACDPGMLSVGKQVGNNEHTHGARCPTRRSERPCPCAVA